MAATATINPSPGSGSQVQLLTSFGMCPWLQATYQFLTDHGEVEVWVHSDDSCLSTQKHGRFISHLRPQTRGILDDRGRGSREEATLMGGEATATSAFSEQLYAAHCVPESAWGGQSGRYSLAPLAAHAIKFR